MQMKTKAKIVFASAVICAASTATAQDWTSASETLYFEYDRAAKQSRVDTNKIREVLGACDISSINIVGHTDTDGNAAYNQALSLRRAETLKAEIVRLGFNANSITTRGAGENELAVLTGDNVKEALNRRAVVQFGFNQPCGIYYTQPVYSEPVVSESVTYTQPAEVVTQEVVTYVEPAEVVTYSQPAPVAQPAPVVQAPTPVVQAPPAPVAATPVPAAPPPVVVPAGGGIPTSLIVGGAAAALVGLGLVLSENDDDDEPVSP